MNHYTAKKWIGKKFLGLLKYLSIEFLFLDVVGNTPRGADKLSYHALFN